MCRQWEIAKHCHTALSFLLLNIQRQSRDQDSNTIGTRSKREYQPDHTTSSEENKRQKIVNTAPDRDDSTTTYQGDQVNEEPQRSVEYSQIPSTAAIINQDNTSHSYHEPDEQLFPRRFTQQEHPNTVHNYDEDANNNTNPPQQHQPQQPSLPMPDISEFEDFQWPDESSFLTTNFDLNMTDLFQNSSWDPMLFDAFTQGQMSPPW
jgi:hypothetical protein